MTIYALLSLFVAVFTVGTGLYVYVKSIGNKSSQIFFFFTIASSVIAIVQYQLRVVTDYQDAYLWSKIFAVWPYGLLFAVHFVLELNRKKKRPISFYLLLYLPAIIISFIQFSSDSITTSPVEKYWGWSIQYNHGFFYYMAFAFGLIYWIIALSLLYYYHKKFSGKARKQTLFVFIGFLFSFFVSMVFDVVFPALGFNFPEIGIVSIAIAIAIIAYGILYYDLYTIDSDPLLTKLFTSLSNYLILVDQEGHILEINDKLLARLMYSYDEVIYKKINIFLSESIQNVNPLSKHIEQYITFDNRELIFKSKEGELIAITFSASYVKLKDNMRSGLLYVGNEDCSSINNQELHNNDSKQTSFLAVSALDILNSTNTNEIYEYITAKLFTLYDKKAIIAYVEINERETFLNWEVKEFRGLGDIQKTISKLIGFSLDQLKGVSKINTIVDFEDGKLQDIDFHLTEYTNGVVSKGTEKAILKLIGRHKLSVIPIFHNGKISGVIAILSNKNTPKINKALVESFIEIASIVLKRKYFEVELADLNEMQTKLFSVIGHDLRSPLANILGFTDIIIEDFDEYSREMLLEYLQSIKRSAESGFSILDGLLLWSKSIQGGVPFKPDVIDLKAMATESVAQLSQLAIKKDITIIIDVDEDIFISADKNMMTTVIRNLLSNAIKFTNTGGQIQLVTNVKKAQVYFSIIDNGLGMSSKQLGELFKPDNLLMHRGTDGEKGSGFGLLICKDFVERNSGRIIVESTEGEGSTFSLLFQRVHTG